MSEPQLTPLCTCTNGGCFYCPERKATFLALDWYTNDERLVANVRSGKVIVLDRDTPVFSLGCTVAIKALRDEWKRQNDPETRDPSMKEICAMLNEGADA